MYLPSWAIILIICLCSATFIGCTAWFINNKIQSNKIDKLVGRPLEANISEIQVDSKYSSLYIIEPPISIYISNDVFISLDTIKVWLEDLVVLWDKQTTYHTTKEQVYTALYGSKIAFVPFLYLTTAEGLASGLCYYPQKHIYIATKDKKNNNKTDNVLKSLFIHEVSHIVLFQVYSIVKGEKHHEIFKECGIS